MRLERRLSRKEREVSRVKPRKTYFHHHSIIITIGKVIIIGIFIAMSAPCLRDAEFYCLPNSAVEEPPGNSFDEHDKAGC